VISAAKIVIVNNTCLLAPFSCKDDRRRVIVLDVSDDRLAPGKAGTGALIDHRRDFLRSAREPASGL